MPFPYCVHYFVVFEQSLAKISICHEKGFVSYKKMLLVRKNLIAWNDAQLKNKSFSINALINWQLKLLEGEKLSQLFNESMHELGNWSNHHCRWPEFYFWSWRMISMSNMGSQNRRLHTRGNFEGHFLVGQPVIPQLKDWPRPHT